MADDKTQVGGQDRRRIHVNEDDELRDWAARFGVCTERLCETVLHVSDHADEVGDCLKEGTR